MESTTTLSQKEIVRAMTNDPALSERQVVLGDRTFTVVDLAYDDYCEFLALFQPLLEAIASKFAARKGIAVMEPETPLSVQGILKYCKRELPEMAALVCKATDASITATDVKALESSPLKLVTVVLAQVEQNKMIKDITDFFVQILPLVKAVMPMVGEKSPSTTL